MQVWRIDQVNTLHDDIPKRWREDEFLKDHINFHIIPLILSHLRRRTHNSALSRQMLKNFIAEEAY